MSVSRAAVVRKCSIGQSRWLHFFAALAALASGVALELAPAAANPFVRLDYNIPLSNRLRNTAVLELFDDKNLTRDNFLLYVNGGKYDGNLVHRLARNFVLQAGGYYPEFLSEPAPVNVSLNPDAQVDLDGNPATANPTVVNEYSKGTIRSNQLGTIAMARRGGQPDSADSEWFVNYGNNSNLDSVDGGFTVFGRVAGDGMTLLSAYNGGLSIVDLNPDRDNDGIRDGVDPNQNTQLNPFGNGSTDGVPVLSSLTGVLVIDDAQQIDYYATSLPLNVPAGGLTISARDAMIDTGATFTGAGTTVTVGANRKLLVREGISVTKTLVNQGTLEPGMQLGSITVQAYQQAATGKLEIQLAGITVDTLYDRLAVTGTAQLGGTLDVQAAGGFALARGNSFTVLTAASITGSFSTTNLPQLNTLDGLVWDVVQTATSLTLNVVRADYNHNGVVDGGDFLTWQQLRGTTNVAADGNGDGVVDNLDLTEWAKYVGRTDGGAAVIAAMGGVPEPSSAALAAAALAALGRRRRAAGDFLTGRTR